MMPLAMVMLSLGGLWIISDPGDNIGYFFSGDSISAGIGLKKFPKASLALVLNAGIAVAVSGVGSN